MSPKKFFYILVALLVVVMAAGGTGYYFASKSLQQGTSALSQRLADEEAADNQLNQLTDLRKQYQKMLPLLPVINNALPKEKNQSRVALQLRNIASESGMELSNITFPASPLPGPTSQTVKVGDVLAIPVTFKLSGSYDQLQAFLHRQETLDRYTSVTSLGISRVSDQQLNYEIALNVFMKP